MALPQSLPSARDRLLDAALELFATRGFQAIGLRDLAGHLGLHAGSLYHHIENKQSLLFELIEGAFSDLLHDTQRRLKSARNPGERLQRFIQAFARFNANEPYRLVLMTREFVNLDEAQQTKIIQLKDRYASLLSQLLEDETGHAGSGPILLLILFGQSQWYSGEISESRLMQVVRGMSAGGY
ncbi:TetR/AcrR family transcriptional regulator [Pseudomonas poae]|nr:TetR/AcrR family transcriptional regulator [Pseudomonas poae]PRA24899.1 TetR family transcriptional regulator [Pseudomonas poae]